MRLLCIILISLAPFQTTQTRTDPRSKVIDSLFVLLKPGQTYTLRFDKPLPVSGIGKNEKPPYREWGSGYVRLLEERPCFVRFRTLTLQEALQEVEKVNAKRKEWGGEPVDPDSVRRAFEGGAPFTLAYFRWFPPQGGKPAFDQLMLQISLSIETSGRRAKAQRRRVETKGLQIRADVNRVNVRIFLIPEGKDKVLYIMPR